MKIKVKSIEIDFSDDVCDCPPPTTTMESRRTPEELAQIPSQTPPKCPTIHL
jgi:hypothetical protein